MSDHSLRFADRREMTAGCRVEATVIRADRLGAAARGVGGFGSPGR